MTGPSRIGALALVAILAACGGESDGPRTGFRTEPDTAMPIPNLHVLRMDRDSSDGGVARLDADILLPLGVGEATARASMQHLIDSLAAVDTMVAAIRITGFMLGRARPGENEVDVEPVVQARWVPVDPENPVGLTGSRRRARFRTHYVILGRVNDSTGAIRP